MSESISMSTAIAEGEGEPRSRSLLMGSRLMLGANATLQSTFLFAYLYLRANNFGGMWRPGGVSTPAPAIDVLVLLVPVAGALAFGAAVRFSEGALQQRFTAIFGGALLLALATVAVRVYQLTHTGWGLDQGGYVDASVIWFAVVLAEFVIGALWAVSVYAGHVRHTVPASRPQVRVLFEYWLSVTAIAVFVFLLVQFVT